MTQAFNLSQLANFVNTSGQLNAATGLYNQMPVANGGTGKSSVTSGALLLGAGTSAMTELTGTTANTTVVASPTGWISAPIASVAGGDYIMRTYTTPQSWTKPATIKAIKVTVIGAGGNGGPASRAPSATGGASGAGGGGGGGASIRYFDAPAIPGPVNVTAGPGTNSFGPWNPASPAPTVTMSATAGANALNSPAGNPSAGGSGGVGSNGNLNIGGGGGASGSLAASGSGGNSILGGGAAGITGNNNGNAGRDYGGGGGGAQTLIGPATTFTGGTGANGIVIVEEFY